MAVVDKKDPPKIDEKTPPKIISENKLSGEKKRGVAYKTYKKYRSKYRNKENMDTYFHVRYLKFSKDSKVNGLFWEMRTVYLTHKFDSQAQFDKLSPRTKHLFATYGKYHGYALYKKYKERVF